ncbi:MAG: tRNA 4-thiouridine(8) synthase ThiI [Thermoproteota archaeon]|nr:MAG: tRNA 4-thiouridine(8) synthase ThiI [Candidatus Korarchaeota archaeon]
MLDSVVVRFGPEIGVKSSRVRLRMEKRVCEHILKALEHYGLEVDELEYTFGRLYLYSSRAEEAAEKAARVFGVSSTSPAKRTSSNLSEIAEAAVKLASSALHEEAKFAVSCRRVGEHPYTSGDVCSRVGEAILEALGCRGVRVDLDNPDVTVGIEVREDKAFVYTQVLKGPGGFPAGTQGKSVCLISGGMDSPVACWLIMRRGSLPVFLTFNTHPYGGEELVERALECARILMTWAIGFKARAYIVPHGQLLDTVVKKAPRALTCVLCKRAMLRVAERVAVRERAQAVVTGESLGEQASQTIWNLRVISQAASSFPVLRPLIGFDKPETDELARRRGTCDVTARRASGCKAAPDTPAIKARVSEVAAVEQKLSLPALAPELISKAKVLELP